MVPMFVVMGTIFFLSHQPGNELKLPVFPGADKVAHFIAYGVLASTVIFAHKKKSLIKEPFRVAMTTILVPLFYGISDEFHQSFIPSRDPSVGDIVADTLGGVFVVIVFMCCNYSHPQKRGSKARVL